MRRGGAIVCAAAFAGAAALGPLPSAAEPINTLVDVSRALEACFVFPPLELSREDMEITVRFGLTRDGNILGEPRFTYITRDVPMPIRSAYQKAVAEAFMRCMPLSFTPGLGGAIAGRIFSWRIRDSRPHRKA